MDTMKHEPTKQEENPHKTAIRRAVRIAISRLGTGTVGVGRECLWQLTVTHIKGGPVGTNAALVAKQIFDEVVAEEKYRGFVYAQ